MSDGKIEKISQRTGERGRPRQVDVHGAGTTKIVGGSIKPAVNVLGAPPAHGKTEIIDQTTPRPQDEHPADVRVHVENVVEDTRKIRGSKREPGSPEIRVRTMAPEARKEWDDVKKGRD